MLQLLDDKERMVIISRYGLSTNEESRHLRDNDSSTLEEVAQELGVSRERVRQIEMQALKKIKRGFLRWK